MRRMAVQRLRFFILKLPGFLQNPVAVVLVFPSLEKIAGKDSWKRQREKRQREKIVAPPV
jgi:hypothetical protein